MLRLGIIGCGRVTTMFHLKAIKGAGNVELVALADNSEERLREVEGLSGVKRGYKNYWDMLRDPNVQAVAVNTPPVFHKEMTLNTLDAGKHVLCEKPLAETVEDCRVIQRKQRETGLVVLPTHQYVFTPSLRRVEERLRAGEIGRLERVSVSFENNLGMYGSKTDFRTGDPRGLVDDVMPHVLSVSSLFTGHPTATRELVWWCKSYKVCDNLKVTMDTERGVRLECSLSWTRIVPRFSVVLEGSEGRLSTDLMINPHSNTLEKNGSKQTERSRGLDWYIDLAQYKHPAFSELYKHFADAAEGREKQRISIDDEIAMLRAMDDVASRLTPEAKAE